MNDFHRELPQAPDAEKGVIASVLLAPVECLGLLAEEGFTGDEFYIPAHQNIFSAIREVADRGKPVNFLTLAQNLTDRQLLEQIGGPAHLNDLCVYLPTAVNLRYYVEIVREKATLRRLIQVCSETIAKAYEHNDQEALLDAFEQSALKIRPASGAQVPAMREVVMQTVGNIQRLYESRGAIDGLAVGLSGIDDLLDGLKGTNLYIIAARPASGKTAMLMQMAEHIAIDLEKPVAVFSAEMSRQQLVQRGLLGRARVNSVKLRNGFLAERDFGAIQAAASTMSPAPMWIDDTSSPPIAQIRARARRWKKEKGIVAIFVDYLQLVTSPSKQGAFSREREVAEISEGLKAMAKELEIPVVAAAQLNRKSEDREGGRPKMSDLRESGCLSVKTTKLLTTAGVRWNLPSRMNTYSLNSSGNVVARVSKNLPRGSKQMARLVLKSGRFLDCTPDHPILTDMGFIPAHQITGEHSVATVRKIQESEGKEYIAESRWIGWMLGNGSMVGYSSPSFICSCSDVAAAFLQQTKALFGLTPRPHRHTCKKVFQWDITTGPVRTAAGNPCKDWLKSHDLWGRRSPEKTIPGWFLEQADNRSIAELLAGLIDTDGTATRNGIKYSTTSNEMAWQVVWCFARMGIYCYIDDGFMSSKANHKCFTVSITDGRDVARFKELIPIIGRKARKLMSFKLSPSGSNHGDRVGTWIQREIESAAKDAGMSWKSLGYRAQGKRISQDDLKKVLEKLPAMRRFGHLISDSIYWDRMESRRKIPDGEVFDREVTAGPHNFVANGIIVHNCIEQAADVVGLLWREEMHLTDQQAKDEAEGKATLIIAKQRNGPVGDVPLTFLKEFTHFTDRATQGEPQR